MMGGPKVNLLSHHVDHLIIKLFLFYLTQSLVSLSSASIITYSEINECQKVIDNPGAYLITWPRENEEVNVQCVVLFKVDESRVIKVHVETEGLDCSQQVEAAFSDGVSVNNAYFPSEGIEEPQKPICKSSEIFRSGQNVATLFYMKSSRPVRILLTVSFPLNNAPCNIIAINPNTAGSFRLSNHGARRNCTYLIVAPSKVAVIDSNLPRAEQPGACQTEYYEIRSGVGLEIFTMTKPLVQSCSMVDPGNSGLVRSPCFATMIRLVSSGLRNNWLSFEHAPYDEVREGDCLAFMTN